MMIILLVKNKTLIINNLNLEVIAIIDNHNKYKMLDKSYHNQNERTKRLDHIPYHKKQFNKLINQNMR